MSTRSLSHGAEPFFRNCQLCSHSRTSQHFIEPEGSVPCSQEPSTGSCLEPHQSNSYHSISLTSILILSIHLRLGLPSGLFPTGFTTYILFSPHSCYMSCPSYLHWLDGSNYTWRSVQVKKLLIMQFSPTSCHFIPLRSEYSQHCSQTVCLCSPLMSPIQSHRLNYNFVYTICG
jgi:hypothetical protein